MTNCVANVYTSAAAAATAIATIDDTKYLGMAVVVEEGMPRIIVVHKT